MALALLTGCSGGKAEDRAHRGEHRGHHEAQPPQCEGGLLQRPAELSGAVRSAFAPGWLNEAGTVLERDALTQDGRTVEVFLKDSLKAYEEAQHRVLLRLRRDRRERLCPVGAVRAGESPVAPGLLSEGVDYGLHKRCASGSAIRPSGRKTTAWWCLCWPEWGAEGITSPSLLRLPASRPGSVDRALSRLLTQPQAGLRHPAFASLSLASCWPLPQQLLPVSAAGGGRRRCPQRERPWQAGEL